MVPVITGQMVSFLIIQDIPEQHMAKAWNKKLQKTAI